jgi:hypothetical protein
MPTYRSAAAATPYGLRLGPPYPLPEERRSTHDRAAPLKRAASHRPRRGPRQQVQANASVARTSASTFSASNAEWPDAGVISSDAFGHALCRSQAFCTGQTTS